MLVRKQRIHLTRFVIFCLLGTLGSILSLAGCSGGNQNILPASMAVGGPLTLSWNPVPGASSYNVYFATSPAVTKLNGYRIPDASNPITITDLERGTTYYFVVTVVNESGESEESREIAYTVKDTAGSIDFKDLFPQGASSRQGSSAEGQVTIAWENEPTAVSYNIYWRDSPGVTKQNGRKISNVKTPYTLKGLTRGATYYFVVTAVNESGESRESEELSFTVGE
ncbi:MAG: fibronectin type III domain-containing protein [Desulfobacterales bacterium]|nr:MAG: fibronectin type III domain-containing protein [Desulfobacterales bacterium]